MSHMGLMPATGESEEKEKGKIESLNVRLLDDGTFLLSVNTDKMESKEYSYDRVEDLLAAIGDDLTSPHMRKSKKRANTAAKKEGAALKKELSRSVKKHGIAKHPAKSLMDSY